MEIRRPNGTLFGYLTLDKKTGNNYSGKIYISREPQFNNIPGTYNTEFRAIGSDCYTVSSVSCSSIIVKGPNFEVVKK